MILTRDEIAFLDVDCHEGTELPFGDPAIAIMTSIEVQNGDTVNLQWAYLRDQPPTSPTIGHASQLAPPLPWTNRDAVLRRDATNYQVPLTPIRQTYTVKESPDQGGYCKNVA